MKSFLQQFLDSTNPQLSSNEIAAALSQFRVNILPELCKNISSEKLINNFETIFNRLLKCCENDSSSVRVSCFPALTSFLSKMIRSYPEETKNAFISFATKCVSVTKGSILIIFSFCYISNFIAKPFFEEFFLSAPIFHHFVNCESDDLAHVIKNLPKMNKDNLLTLLIAFIDQYKKTHNSKIMVPIQKIVEIRPNGALEEVLKSNEISLISFIFTTIDLNTISFNGDNSDNKNNKNNDKDGNNNEINEKSKNYDFELKEIALNALKKLNTAELSERDDCFQILSIKSKSFEVKFDLLDKNQFENKNEAENKNQNENENENNNKNDENIKNCYEKEYIRISIDDESVVLKIGDYSDLPYFYSLFLPDSILFPRKEIDSHNVINAKFNTIGRKLSNQNQVLDVEEYIELFDNFLCNNKCPKNNYNIKSKIKDKNNDEESYFNQYNCYSENYFCNYNGDTSSALKSFSTSLPCLISNARDHRLVRIIRFIINSKITSWMHGLDVLKVIESMKDHLLNYISLRERLDILLKLSLNRNESLSNSAIQNIVQLANHRNFQEISNYISKSIDFFSCFSVQKKLKILSLIIRKYQKSNRSHLDWIVTILNDENLYLDFISETYTLAEIFDFHQFFKNANEKLAIIANNVLIYSLLYLKGCDYTNKIQSINLTNSTTNLNSYYKDMIETYVNSKSIDVVSEHPFDFKENFPLIANCYAFYMSQTNLDKKSSLFFIDQFFEYFPYESTCRLFTLVEFEARSMKNILSSKTFNSNLLELEINFKNFTQNNLLLKNEIKTFYSLTSSSFQIVDKLSKKLAIVTDPHTFALWTRLIGPNNDHLMIPKYASYYLSHSKEENVTAEDFNAFALYLHSFGHRYEAIITVSLLDIDPKIVSDYVFFALKQQDFVLKYNKELNKKSAMFCDNFDLMEDEYKLEYIREFVKRVNKTTYSNSQKNDNNKPNKKNEKEILSPSMINYGMKNLSGWEKMTFEMKVRKMNQNSNHFHLLTATSSYKPSTKIESVEKANNNSNFIDVSNERAFNLFFCLKIRDDLQSLLQYYIDIDNVHQVKHILRLSIIRGFSFNFMEMRISRDIWRKISLFFKKRRIFFKGQFNPTKYVDDLLKSKENSMKNNIFIPIKKMEIVEICQFVNEIDITSDVVFNLFKTFTNKHQKCLLILLANFLFRINNEQSRRYQNSSKCDKPCLIKNDFVDAFFHDIKLNEEFVSQISFVLHQFSQNAEVSFNEEQMSITRSLFGLCCLNSIEMSVLFSTLISIIKDFNTSSQNNNSNIIINNNIGVSILNNEKENNDDYDVNENKDSMNNGNLINENENNNIIIADNENDINKNDINKNDINKNDINENNMNENNMDENNMNENNINENKENKENNEKENNNNGNIENIENEKYNNDNNENENENESRSHSKTTNPSSRFVSGNLINVINNYLDGDYPSQFLSGMRILNQCLRSMKEKSSDVIEPCLMNVIGRTFELSKKHTFNPSYNSINNTSSLSSSTLSDSSLTFFNNFIFKEVAKFLRKVLLNKNLVKLHSMIASKFFELLELSLYYNYNSKKEFSILIAPLLSTVLVDNPLYSKLCQLSDKDIEFIASNRNAFINTKILKCYINSLSERINKISYKYSKKVNRLSMLSNSSSNITEDEKEMTLKESEDFIKEKKENYILNFVLMFIQKFKKFDCYSIFVIDLMWVNFIEKNVSLYSLFQIIAEQFIPNAVRFFPIFAVFALKIKSIKKKCFSKNYKNINDKDFDLIKVVHNAIDNSVALMQNEAHIYALNKLKEMNFEEMTEIREALDIAQLETDLIA